MKQIKLHIRRADRDAAEHLARQVGAEIAFEESSFGNDLELVTVTGPTRTWGRLFNHAVAARSFRQPAPGREGAP